MNSVFVKVLVKVELPTKRSRYITNQGLFNWCKKHGFYKETIVRIYKPNGITWWIKEIELPSDADIEGMASFYDAFESDGEDKYSSYKIGANYILNKLK